MKKSNQNISFISRDIHAKFKEFSIPSKVKKKLSVVVPLVKGTPWLKYGKHSYTFYNFETLKGFSVSISHNDIMRLGFKKLARADWNKNTPVLKNLLKKYHYNFSFIEQIMLMTVPHTVTSLGNGRFFVNLWSYFGYLDINCRKRTVKYRLVNDKKYRNVLGSQQFFDSKTNELYYTAYSLKESFERIDHTDQKVHCSIYKKEMETDKTSIVWSGAFTDYIHDIIINKQRRYCIIPELGLYTDKNNNIIPSKVLVLDLKTKQTWNIERFSVAAHAQFDPEDPNIVYFSNHNFNFEHSSIIKLLKKATYSVNFRGPAAVYKYKLTPNGPKEIGVFSRTDFYRLTNFHVFKHRGKMIMAALGFPDVIFIIDAKKMSYIKKIKVKNPSILKNLFSKKPALIGTFSPSFDGEKLYVQTTKSFQVVNIANGKADMIINHFYSRTCSNHMETSSDIDW